MFLCYILCWVVSSVCTVSVSVELLTYFNQSSHISWVNHSAIMWNLFLQRHVKWQSSSSAWRSVHLCDRNEQNYHKLNLAEGWFVHKRYFWIAVCNRLLILSWLKLERAFCIWCSCYWCIYAEYLSICVVSISVELLAYFNQSSHITYHSALMSNWFVFCAETWNGRAAHRLVAVYICVTVANRTITS